MAQNVYQMNWKRWLFVAILLCLFPVMGQLFAHASAAEPCPNCGKELSVTIYAPSCTVEGYTEYRCNECNNYHELVPIPMLAHKWQRVDTIAATCLNSGMIVNQCSVCEKEEIKEIDSQKPLGHEYEETVVEPTCTAKGYKLHSCVRCTDSYISDETEKADHTYTQEILEAPTCESVGYCRKICTVCAEYVTEEMPVVDHSWDSQVIEATHTEQGYTIYTCSFCSTVKRDSFTDFKPFDMVWTIQDATCTESGMKIGYCADGCGHTESIVLPWLGHEYGDWETIRRADEDVLGLESHCCTRCQHVETRTVSYIPEEEQADQTRVTPLMVVIVAFLLIVCLGAMVLVLLLLLEHSGKGSKSARKDLMDLIE